MDIHRIPTHVVRAPSYRNDAAAPPSPRRTARSNSQASDDAVHPRGAMTIPGARLDDAPPPLPPPRFNQELAHGIDVAWSWGNSNPFHYNKKHLAPIQPGSSLYGSYRESPRPSISLRSADDMDLDDDQDHRRGSTVSTIRSPSPSPAQSRIGGHVPSLIRKPPSPAPLNQRLVSCPLICPGPLHDTTDLPTWRSLRVSELVCCSPGSGSPEFPLSLHK